MVGKVKKIQIQQKPLKFHFRGRIHLKNTILTNFFFRISFLKLKIYV